MLATLRKKLKCVPNIVVDSKEYKTSYLLLLFTGLFEEVLFWRTTWLSLTFTVFLQVIILVCVQRQISLCQFLLCSSITLLIMDAFEAWLKFKHRIAFLKRISSSESTNLNSVWTTLNFRLNKLWIDYVFIRETNQTKAFILVNIVMGTIFFLGKYISGYLLIYLFCMFICFAYKLAPPVVKLFKNVLQDIESDSELEGLMPEASDIDIKLLNIEPEKNPFIDETQSLDYWKPNDMAIEEASDSSDNSSSLITNFSMEKVQTLQKDVETSDSSEDEYIPLVPQSEPLQTTFEVSEPSDSWGRSAYNALWNITGAMSNMMHSDKDTKRKHTSSMDSADGFEIIDKNELN